jgi:hypothetical protein
LRRRCLSRHQTCKRGKNDGHRGARNHIFQCPLPPVAQQARLATPFQAVYPGVVPGRAGLLSLR